MMKIDESKNLKTNVALYARVSTDAQAEEGYSIEIQKEKLLAYTKAMAKTPDNIEYYIDDGYTGANLDRPAMARLINDIEDQKITHVIVVKLDRLSRSQKDTLHLIEDVFTPSNVSFISVNENFDTMSSFGRAVIGILSVFAQFERENIYERTRSGMRKRVEAGYWMGGGNVPFGYDYDSTKGTLIPNKDAEIVKKLYEEYLSGSAMQYLASKYSLKYEKLVKQILTRKSNTGIIVYNGQEYKGLHEPIIDEETYYKTMMVMKERAEKKFVSQSDHLLTGLLICGVCGARMRYQKWGKNGDKIICYSQQASKEYLIKDRNCDNDKIWASDIEAKVLEDVFTFTTKKLNKQNEDSTPSAIKILTSKAEDANKKLKKLYTLYATSDDDETLLETINELKEEQQSLSEQIQIEESKGLITTNRQEILDNLKNLKNLWYTMTIQQQQNILRSIIDSIVITKNNIKINYIF